MKRSPTRFHGYSRPDQADELREFGLSEGNVVFRVKQQSIANIKIDLSGGAEVWSDPGCLI